ncbi:Benzoate transporter [Sinomonas atrocyanea]|uniref:Benzoate transporter n=1 Tax=Sinomonas atrocyanea TaxID=37927 RepID=A0A127A0P5_9MICC|nr:benzoate/H(+) symporter BenE family transporter [Sinomonas atrocyanea]AMM32205.1 Benzoate transporter [Sinomonas atrocyanea]
MATTAEESTAGESTTAPAGCRAAEAEGNAGPRRPPVASFSAVMAGFIAVAGSYAGPMVVVLQAATAAHLSAELTASWVGSIAIASGVTRIVLSVATRQPVVVAWSVPGAALLLTALGRYPYSDALGAYVVAAAAALVLGAPGWFGKIMEAVPQPVVAAVLAGVLLPFVLKASSAVVEAPVVGGGLVLAFLLGRRYLPRYAVLAALAAGALLAAATGAVRMPSLTWDFSGPVWTTPTFGLPAVVGISVPLLVVTMAGQNAPGLAMMRQLGYDAGHRTMIGGASLAWLLSAPFGAHGINLAAITAGICAGREAHEDPARRYIAGVSCGAFYILFGLFSTTAVALVAAVPGALLTSLAGVALLAATQGAIVDALGRHGGGGRATPHAAEAAMVTLAVTASGVSALGIVAPFWGLVAGTVAYAALGMFRRQRPRSAPR